MTRDPRLLSPQLLMLAALRLKARQAVPEVEVVTLCVQYIDTRDQSITLGPTYVVEVPRAQLSRAWLERQS